MEILILVRRHLYTEFELAQDLQHRLYPAKTNLFWHLTSEVKCGTENTQLSIYRVQTEQNITFCIIFFMVLVVKPT